MEMRKNILLVGFLILSQIMQVNAQTHHMKAFENLVVGSWIFEGKQLGGQDGKTIHEFEWGLEGKIIKTKLYNTDLKTLEFGLRNEGIRAYNVANETIEFYEFDKHGGITYGQILIEGKDIHYDYEYQEMKLRDSWKFIDTDNYELIVGVWQDGEWKTKYHQAIFTRKK